MSDGIAYLLSYITAPLTLIIVGLVTWRFPPKYGENIGYKTRRSRSCEQAWNLAQVYWGRLTLMMNIPVLIVSIGAGVLQNVKDLSEEAGFAIFCVVMAVQIIPIFVSIAITESVLKKHFG